jgi:hypothetical protein
MSCNGCSSRDLQTVERILAWDFKRVIVAHGSIVENHAKQLLRSGFERFLGADLNPVTAIPPQS